MGANDVLNVWMDRLDAERRDVVALLDQLRSLQHRRPLLFDVRPSNLRVLKLRRSPMAKMALPEKARKRA